MRSFPALWCVVGLAFALAISSTPVEASARWSLAPGSYTANMHPYTLTIVVNSQGIITETFDLTSSQIIAPACAIAVMQGRVGTTMTYKVLAGGEGCSNVFGPNGIQIGNSTIGSTGAITTSFTNKTGTFRAPVVASSRIPDGDYCTVKGAAYPTYFKVEDAKYTIAHGASGVNFACTSTGTVIGGPRNVITIDSTTPASVAVKCDLAINTISYRVATGITMQTNKGVISLRSCNPSWSQKQTYCGTLGAWGVNAIIEPDQKVYLQLMSRASAVQPWADYCVLASYFVAMPDGSFRTFPKGAVGDCTKALAFLALKSLTWKGNSLVLATASASVTLQASQCFQPVPGAYGGTAGRYSASLNVLPGRQYHVMFGTAGQSEMSCFEGGEFVNSTAAAVFITSSGGCSAVVKAVTALSFASASKQFTLSGVDATNRTFKMVLQ